MKNWKTTLSSVLSVVLLALWYFALIDPSSLIVLTGLVNAWGFLSAADSGKLQDTFKGKGLVLIGLLFIVGLSSCTKGSFDAFFKQLEYEIPLQKVSYQIPNPDIDTTLIWYSPYKIFANQTQFKADTIYHQEKFNFSGLGDFLWVEYQNWKAKRKGKESISPKPSPTNTRFLRNDKNRKRARDGLMCGLMGVR